jgi:hypothetical protein
MIREATAIVIKVTSSFKCGTLNTYSNELPIQQVKMKRNYYGRRRRDDQVDRKDNSTTNSTAWKKYKETIEKAERSADTIQRTSLLQLAEHYFKLAKDIK